eukprot:Hpha_TRINITY_DN27751_c0_g1::TRINITY_DN27751_c0_g1_i1::g.157025::m.157025
MTAVLLLAFPHCGVYEVAVDRAQMKGCHDKVESTSSYHFYVNLYEFNGNNNGGWTKVCDGRCKRYTVKNSVWPYGKLDSQGDYCSSAFDDSATKIRAEFWAEEDNDKVDCNHYTRAGDTYSDSCLMTKTCEWDIPGLMIIGGLDIRYFTCTANTPNGGEAELQVQIKKQFGSASSIGPPPTRSPTTSPTVYFPTGQELWIYVVGVEMRGCDEAAAPTTFGFSKSVLDDRGNELCDNNICRPEVSITTDITAAGGWGDFCGNWTPGTRSVVVRFYAQVDNTSQPCDSPLDVQPYTHTSDMCMHSGSCHFDIPTPLSTYRDYTCTSNGNSTASVILRVDPNRPPTRTPSVPP